MKNKKKLIIALQTIYDILDEEDHDDVESLDEIEQLLINLRAHLILFPEMSAEEGIKLMAWKMRVGTAVLTAMKVTVGDQITTGDRIVYIGGTGITEQIEM